MPRHPAPQGTLGRRLSQALARAAVRLGQPAWSALVRDRFLTISLALAGASALAAALLARAVLWGASGRTPLTLEPIPDADIGIAWSDLVRGVGATRQQALAGLLDIVAIVAAGAVLVGLITLAALSWSRAFARRDEVAIRRSVGAARHHLAGSAVLEGLGIGLPSLAWGLAAGWLPARLLLREWPGSLDPWHVDAALPAAILLLALGSGSLLLLRHARGRRIDALAPGGLGLAPQVVQMACTLAVLGAAVSLSRQATLLVHTGTRSVDADRVLVEAAPAEPEARAAGLAALLTRLEEDPNVATASVSSPGVALGVGLVDWIQTDCGQCREAGIILQWHNLKAAHHVISPDTFQVLGMPLIAGRTFTAGDGWTSPRVVVVNRHLALRHFQDGDAVGRTLTLGSWQRRVTYTVIGVVDDRQPPALGSGLQPREALYLSVLQHPPTAGELLVQPRSRPASLPTMPGLRLTPQGSLASLRQQEASILTWLARALRFEGALALLAALAGAFVAMRAWSESSLGELALRRAVGAPRWRVLARVGVFALAVVAIGALAARTLVAPAVGWLVAALLRDAAPPVLVTWAPVVLLGLAALAGAVPPAWAASRRPPARTLS